MTGRDTPHARPSETLDGTNTYGTFWFIVTGAAANNSDNNDNSISNYGTGKH